MSLTSILIQIGRNFKHTWGAQLLTLLTVSLSVLIFSFFLLVFINLQKAGGQLGDHIKLIVYLDDEISPQMRPHLEEKIRSFSDVEKITFNNREDAFRHIKKQLGNDQDVLDDLDASFLPPSIEIYPAQNLASIARIKQFSDFLATLPGARKVQYGREWIERLARFTQLVRLIVFLSGGLLVLTSTFMVSSTIRLTVVTRRDELEIMQLLGATKYYIQIPLLFEGVMQGVLGTSLGMSCLYFIYRWIEIRFSGPGFMEIFNFTFMPTSLALMIIAASIGLCSIGSLVSIRKFLRI